MLLEGDGLLLDGGEGEVRRLTIPFAPLRFRGEDRVYARLAGAATRDFNLMVRRGAVDAEVEIRRDAGSIGCNPGFAVFFCARGRWTVVAPEGATHRLGSRQMLIGACGAGPCVLGPLEQDSVLLCVRAAQPRPPASRASGG